MPRAACWPRLPWSASLAPPRPTSPSATKTGIDPTKVPQADGTYEKVIGEKLDWRRFNSGPEVIAAIASGDVQLGNIGSSPLAAATSRGLPIVAFIVSAQINSAEALVVRNGGKIRETRGPGRQDHRHTVRVHLALQPAGRPQALEDRPHESEDRQPQPHRDRRRLAPWRHRRCLRPGRPPWERSRSPARC